MKKNTLLILLMILLVFFISLISVNAVLCGDGSCEANQGDKEWCWTCPQDCGDCYDDPNQEISYCDGQKSCNSDWECGKYSLGCRWGGCEGCDNSEGYGCVQKIYSGKFATCQKPYCGDGTCDLNEDCCSCDADCGKCEDCTGSGLEAIRFYCEGNISRPQVCRYSEGWGDRCDGIPHYWHFKWKISYFWISSMGAIPVLPVNCTATGQICKDGGCIDADTTNFDEDGDGICNAGVTENKPECTVIPTGDQCPNTPPNTLVDSVGCSLPCQESWQCTAWSNCINNKQTRTCSDQNNCGTTKNKPIETQGCTSPPPKKVNPLCPSEDEYLLALKIMVDDYVEVPTQVKLEQILDVIDFYDTHDLTIADCSKKGKYTHKPIYKKNGWDIISIYLGVPLPPSCFDEKKNQDERGKDCGGPCPISC